MSERACFHMKRDAPPTFGRRLAAACVSFAFLLGHAPSVSAAPRPRPDQWWLSAWEIEDKVWPLTTGRGVIIGLIDTGVQANLPELQGAVLKGKTFMDGGGDGRTDEDTEDGGHGTAMATSIAGQGGGSGLVGVAPDARILPLAHGSPFFADQIRYAVARGAKVINISQSAPGECPPETQRGISYAIRHDVVVVTGSGNLAIDKSTWTYPQSCSGALVVAALDADMNVWKKSTAGGTVMAAAPGVAVGAIGKAGIYASKRNGTSYASAFTSALVALVRSRYPNMSGREVVQRLLYTARDVDAKGWDERTGYGALIPYNALTAKVPVNAPNPVYQKFDQLEHRAEEVPTGNPVILPVVKNSAGSTFWMIVAGLLVVTSMAIGISFLRARRFAQ